MARPTPGVLTLSLKSEQWRRHRRRRQLVAALVLLVGVAVGMWFHADRTAAGDPSGARLLFIGIALVLGPMLALHSWLLLVRRIDSGSRCVVVVPPSEVRVIERRLRLEESGHGGLGFRYSRPITWLLVVMAVAWSVPGWWLVTWSFPDHVVFLILPSVVFMLPLLSVLRRAFRRGVLILTPDRVLHRSWGADLWVPWQEAARAWERSPGAPKGTLTLFPRAADRTKRFRLRMMWPAVMERRIPPAPSPLLTMGNFGAHPVVVGESLVFYARNAERRGELGTQAAVDRVRRAVEEAR